MLINYNEDELLNLINNQVEENLHLDYKGAESLQKTDGKKKELSKDVSAFANSDGGIIIFGIREFDDPQKRYLPEKIDPVDRLLISKEWIEQVLNSNIQPKILGLLIHPIPLSSSPNHVSYVVTIPKSNTVHQCSDKKYYRRYNFESVAMEDYEIKDIINRQSTPILSIVLDQAFTSFTEGVVTIPILINNASIKTAKDVKFTIQINDSYNCEVHSFEGLNDISHINQNRRLFESLQLLMIYKGINLRVGSISLKLINNVSVINCTCGIFADNMEPLNYNFGINVLNNQVYYTF